ncbi:MAG: hypothetical protein Q9195_005005 [Heterodermia aff. obscurata]
MAHRHPAPSPASPPIQTTPGAYPSTPGDPDAPTIVSTQSSLSQAVYQRRSEFTRSYTTKVKVGTWNVASLTGTEKDVGGWFVGGKGLSDTLNHLAIDQENGSERHYRRRSGTADTVESSASQEKRRSKKNSTLPQHEDVYITGGENIGLYVLGLQELVNISSVTTALGFDTDQTPGKKWKEAIEKALPGGYELVAEEKLAGLYLVIYASPTLAPQITSVSTTSVGTGLAGLLGNKGAVTARIVLGETTRIVFVNCHLTAGVEKGSLERRNWDAAQVVSRTKFDPISDRSGVMEEFGEGIGDEDFAFWFGDLNYRLESMPGDDVRRLLMLHTRYEYGKGQASGEKIEEELAAQRSPVSIKNGRFVDPTSEGEKSPALAASTSSSESSPSLDGNASSSHLEPATDPASLQTTLSSLLPHDQLHAQMRARKAFYDGWQEGPIDFLPTYKYDVGSVGMFDSSEKKRGPSWCDRILYRSRKNKQEYEAKVREEQEVKRVDAEMKARGIDKEAEDEAILFEYDPETDADHDYQEEETSSVDSEVVETKAGFEDKLHLDSYTSHQRVLSSDHKPLDAVFTLDYEAVDPQLKAKIHQEVARELDKAENEGRPVVTVVIDHHHDHDDNMPEDVECATSEGVNFGHVKYNHPKTRNITIANTGRVQATVGFADRSVDEGHSTGVAPPWLSIKFDRLSDSREMNRSTLQQYTLEPGDAANVELTILVSDINAVRALNDGSEKIDDVLVLRIQDGRDYFLPLRGTWLQSAFGRSIDRLIRLPEGGIRKLQHQHPHGSNHSDEGVKWSAPREILRLTEATEELVERTIAEWGMRGEEAKPPWDDLVWPFARHAGDGNHKEVKSAQQHIREALDSDLPISQVLPIEANALQRLEAVAEVLLELLSSLEDGVIPEGLWTQIERALTESANPKNHFSGEDERMQILEILSTSSAHSVSFTLITFMLSRVSGEIQSIEATPDSQEGGSDAASRSSKESTRPGTSVQGTDKTRRIEREGAYANVFAQAMIRAPVGGKDRERKASEARRKNVVESFVRSKWEGET